MTHVELGSRGYTFITIHGQGVTISIQHRHDNWTAWKLVGTCTAPTRMEAMHAALERATVHFVENKLAS